MVLTVISCAINIIAFNSSEKRVVAEKLIEVEREVNIIADDIRRKVLTDDDWDTYDYVGKITSAVEVIDEQHMVFGGVYQGEDLLNLSQRTATYENEPFDPKAFPEFLKMVEEKKHRVGTHALSVHWEPESKNVENRDAYIMFRWVPLVEGIDNPFLVVVAISDSTVETPIPPIVYVSNFGLPLIIALLSILLLLFKFKGTKIAIPTAFSRKYAVKSKEQK